MTEIVGVFFAPTSGGFDAFFTVALVVFVLDLHPTDSTVTVQHVGLGFGYGDI